MAAAAISSVSIHPIPKKLISSKFQKSHLKISRPISLRRVSPIRRGVLASKSSPPAVENREDGKGDEESMSIDVLNHFVDLNLGIWNGSFAQFDAHGTLLQNVATRLSGSKYGEDELVSLIQTLYIKQPPSKTSVSGYSSEPEWAEYKIKETNMFTADKYQQIGFFSKEKAFTLRYQTAGMLEMVLRAGILGEDDIGEESPRNLKLPSQRPSIVCESCLYSKEKDMRARAFHIMDPKGVLEMLLVFVEERGDLPHASPSFGSSQENTERIAPLLGKWKGHSITKRSGVYGATIAEADTVALIEMDERGRLIQDITSTSVGGTATMVHWKGTISDNLVVFDGGFQMTLLPGGMYMGCPCDVGRSVAKSQSFHLEFCWMESPGKRQRLVRTYDIDGLAVSSTYIFEIKV